MKRLFGRLTTCWSFCWLRLRVSTVISFLWKQDKRVQNYLSTDLSTSSASHCHSKWILIKEMLWAKVVTDLCSAKLYLMTWDSRPGIILYLEGNNYTQQKQLWFLYYKCVAFMIMQLKSALWFVDESFTHLCVCESQIRMLSVRPFDFIICFKPSVSNNRECCWVNLVH